MKKRKRAQHSNRAGGNNRLTFGSLEERKLLAAVSGTGLPTAHIGPATVMQVQTQTTSDSPTVQRIVNGEQTNAFPAVGFVGPLGCTGTLISPTHVLTAAHCLPGVGNTEATFVLNGQTYNSVRVTMHPEYNDNNFGAGNDIAIIELARPVNGVTPMNINRVAPQVGSMMTLAGFGEGGTSTGGFDSNDTGKQVGQTELEGVTNHHLTWNFDSHNESNTAPGDSGGPAFISVNGRQVIAGVTSGGSGDPHTLGDESFDTRVDVHAAWIDSIVGTAPDGDTDAPGGGTGSDTDTGDDQGDPTLADDHSDRPTSGATKINLNSNGAGSASGTFEEAGDRDAFEFTLTSSGATRVALTGLDGLDTHLRIYDSRGRLVAQNDDIENSLNSRITKTIRWQILRPGRIIQRSRSRRLPTEHSPHRCHDCRRRIRLHLTDR